jgi:DSHCT (NUC185) domain
MQYIISLLIKISRFFFYFCKTSDLSTTQVVTAWSNGCSWDDALEISGLPPGDLVRLLSRVLDALRQLGNLPYRPIRRNDYNIDDSIEHNNDKNIRFMSRRSCGIHPDIIQLSRLASKSMDRYPVKDSFMLEVYNNNDDDDDNEQNDKDEIDNYIEFQNDDIVDEYV